MNFVEASPLPDPETAARKLIEIANGVEAVQDGPRRRRVAQAPVPFKLGGSPDRYGAGVTGYSATRQETRDRRRKTLGSVDDSPGHAAAESFAVMATNGCAEVVTIKLTSREAAS